MELSVGICVPRTSGEAECTAFLGMHVLPFSVPTSHTVFLRCVSTEEILKLVFTAGELVWVLQGPLQSLQEKSAQRLTLEGKNTGQCFWLDLKITVETPPEIKCPSCEVWRRMAQSLQNDQESSLDPGFLSDLEAFPLAKISYSLPIALTEQDRAHLKTTLIHANEQEKTAEMLQSEVERLNAIIKDLLNKPPEIPRSDAPCSRCSELLKMKLQLEAEVSALRLQLQESQHEQAALEAKSQVLSAEVSLRAAQLLNAQALSADLHNCKNLLAVSEDQRMTLLRDMTKMQTSLRERLSDIQSDLQQVTAQRDQFRDEAQKLVGELDTARSELQKEHELRLLENAERLQRKADIEASPSASEAKKWEQLQEFETHLSAKLEEVARANESLLQDKAQLQSALDILEEQLQQREEEVQSLKRDIHRSDSHALEDLSLLKAQVAAYDEVSKALRAQLNAELPQLVKMLSAARNGSSRSAELESLKQTVAAQERELSELKGLLLHPTPEYVPQSDDPVDQTLANYLNSRRAPMPVQFQRKEPGVYMFGSKRVFIRIENGKVIIRVGGGYMNIEEFLAIYTPMELGHVQQDSSYQSPRQMEEKLTSQLENSGKSFTTCLGVRKRNLSMRKS